MKNKKFSKHNKDKRINTIIEIRKEVLEAIQFKYNNLDFGKYNEEDRKNIRKELREIAELVRDKDIVVEQLEDFESAVRANKNEKVDLIGETRKQVIKMLHFKRDSIIATQYDQEELGIVHQELKEMEDMVIEKDRLFGCSQQKGQCKAENKKRNAHLNKYFNFDAGPNLE
mgnify:CR=1 FL=1